MKKFVFALLCLALFIVACASQPDTTTPEVPQQVAPEPPVVDETPTEPVVPEENAKPVDSGLDKVFGPPDDEQVITADDVLCWPDEHKVSFRFRNLDSKSWQLNQEIPFPPPSDIGSVRITLNGYEVNARKPVIYNGELLFRTEGKQFSDDCGGVTELASGKEITCTVSPVVLKKSVEGFVSGVNELRVNGPGADGIARFTCE